MLTKKAFRRIFITTIIFFIVFVVRHNLTPFYALFEMYLAFNLTV